MIRAVTSWGLGQVSRKVSQGRRVWVKQAPVGHRRHREPDNSCHREGDFDLPQTDQSAWWGGVGDTAIAHPYTAGGNVKWYSHSL